MKTRPNKLIVALLISLMTLALFPAGVSAGIHSHFHLTCYGAVLCSSHHTCTSPVVVVLPESPIVAPTTVVPAVPQVPVTPVPLPAAPPTSIANPTVSVVCHPSAVAPSQPIAQVPVPTLPAIPTTPSGVFAVRGQAALSVVVVTWTQVTDVAISGYEIYRSIYASSEYVPIYSITSSTAVQFNDTSVEVSRAYYYRVRSYTVVNGYKVYSGWSSACGPV